MSPRCACNQACQALLLACTPASLSRWQERKGTSPEFGLCLEPSEPHEAAWICVSHGRHPSGAVLNLQERDEAVERVLAVEVLHLLATEGAHGQVVADRLAASEVWQAYQGQRHDLFLPGGATPQVRRMVVCDGYGLHGQVAGGPHSGRCVAGSVCAGCHAVWLHDL